MMWSLIRLVVVVTASGAVASSCLAADAVSGTQVAQRWCVNCHVIGDAQAGSVPQGPPSFRAITQRGYSGDEIRAFLSHPHGAMPDLSLTRVEIDNLLAYLQTIR